MDNIRIVNKHGLTAIYINDRLLMNCVAYSVRHDSAFEVPIVVLELEGTNLEFEGTAEIVTNN